MGAGDIPICVHTEGGFLGAFSGDLSTLESAAVEHRCASDRCSTVSRGTGTHHALCTRRQVGKAKRQNAKTTTFEKVKNKTRLSWPDGRYQRQSTSGEGINTPSPYSLDKRGRPTIAQASWACTAHALRGGAPALDRCHLKHPRTMLPHKTPNMQPSILAGMQKEDASNDRFAAWLC